MTALALAILIVGAMFYEAYNSRNKQEGDSCLWFVIIWAIVVLIFNL